MKQLLQGLRSVGIKAVSDYPLAGHTSFRIGGNAAIACFPGSREQMLEALRQVCRHGTRYVVIGNASNVVFDDSGFSGAVIFTDKWKELSVGENRIRVSAGVSLMSVATVARDLSLSGVEFAYGIPGTVGGAVFMNAGAYGASMSDICVSSEYVDTKTGRVVRLEGAEQDFAYRSSIYAKNPHYAILGAALVLSPDDKTEISARMNDFLTRRKSTQPLELPSAGSVFKRPVGHFAGKLIEDCGLKGLRIGGAEISEKHAGFIVNRGGATAADVRALVETVRDRVYSETGVCLECEIRFI